MSQADRNTNNVEPLFLPVSHYDSPEDVLDDARLSTDEKRAILSSWASDMYVVESRPTLREVPGMSHRLRLDDILAALKQLDDEPDPPPGGGSAMRLPRFSRLECAASVTPRRITHRQAATRQQNRSRWTRDANVRRYRRLLSTPLTDLERGFVERRIAAELHECSVPFTTTEGNDVCQL
jgi:hypothetical protein